MATTDQTVLDAAVRIVDEVIASTDAPFAEQVANDVFATLARAGWLHDPKRVAALEALAEAAVAWFEDAEEFTNEHALMDAIRAIMVLPAEDGAR